MTIGEWREDGQYLDYKGHRIFYKEAGEKEAPSLLLIHGFPTASWDWWQMWPKLSEQFHVIALDMIGFGFSDKPRSYSYSLFEQADTVETLLKDRQLRDYHILCHDYGDTVGQELLARQNEGSNEFNLKSVCFLNGGLFPGIHKPLPIQWLLMTPLGPLISKFFTKAKLARNFRKIFGPNTQPSAADIDSFWALIEMNGGRKVVHKLIQYMAQREKNKARWGGALQNAKIPLRLIDGLYDPISGQNIADHYAAVVPNADVVGLEGIGHFPPVEAPEQVLKHYLEFVNVSQNGNVDSW